MSSTGDVACCLEHGHRLEGILVVERLS